MDPERLTFRVAFQGNPVMMARCEALLAGGPDPHPGTSGSSFLEVAMADLSAGRPLPLAVRELNGWVERSVEELFVLRDARAVS